MRAVAEYIHHDDDPAGRGFNSALGVILAILLVLALLVGGWWLFFRGPVDTTRDETTIEDTDINIEDSESQDTTSP